MNREIFKAKIAEVISSTNKSGNEKLEAILAVVDAYSSADNGVKPIVSGALPLAEKLESKIEDCDCGLDDVSWGMQEGILISVREAKQLVALLRQ